MELVVEVGKDQIPRFLNLLVPEFVVETRVGNNLKVLVCGKFGVNDTYFEERIQTIFLNSKPVDDVNTAIVHDGDVLALSAAMPGLVGATFRKGGTYSWMRGSISHLDNSDVTAGKIGRVTVKLFNMILKELGPFFLEAGVWLKGETIQAFFTDRASSLAGTIQSVFLNGREVAPNAILTIEWQEEPVHIKIVNDLLTK